MGTNSGERISNFTTFANNILAENGHQSDTYPLAGVFYNQRNNFSLIAERRQIAGCDLLAVETQPPATDALQMLFDAGGRFQSLNRFDQLKIAQVGLRAPILQRSQSIHQNTPEVFASFSVRDCLTGVTDIANHGEKDLHQVLTGEAGGVLIFENGGLPQEAGLLVDKQIKVGSRDRLIRLGMLYLFHPEDAVHGSVDSITSLGNFFESYASDIAGVVGNSEMDKALDLFEQASDSAGQLGEARKQLLKARVVAHTRMYELTKNPKYLDFVKTYLIDNHASEKPQAKPKKRMFPFFSGKQQEEKPKVVTPKFELALSPLFIGRPDFSDVSSFMSKDEELDLGFKKAISDSAELVVRELRSVMARSARLAMDPYFPDNEEMMFVYIKNLGKFARWAVQGRWNGEPGIEDVETLLLEFQRTDYAKTHRFRGVIDWRGPFEKERGNKPHPDVSQFASPLITYPKGRRRWRDEPEYPPNPVRTYAEIIDEMLGKLKETKEQLHSKSMLPGS